MADFKSYSGMRKENLVIPAYSMQSVFFDTINPNYYRLHNQGTTTLYCATSHQPTANQYDFAVPGEMMKVYAEPFERNVLFIFNPSAADVPVTLLTFRAEFDPLALVLSDLSLDLSGTTFESSNTITGFECALPAGTNKLGSVDVDNIDELAAGLNESGNPYYGEVEIYTAVNTSAATAVNDSGKCVVHFLTNDGEGDLTFYIGQRPLTLKAGESIQDFKFNGPLSVGGNGYSFRALVTKG